MAISETMVRDIENAIDEYEKITGYVATRTRQMIDRKGYEKALSDLMINSKIQQGLRTLANSGKSNLTFEAIALNYPDQFSEKVREVAEWRLDMAAKGEL